jgi:hypothetical protein
MHSEFMAKTDHAAQFGAPSSIKRAESPPTRALKGVMIVADNPVATVVFLRSHPRWFAAQRRAQQRSEDMRRHPSFLARRHATASGGESAAVVPMLRMCPRPDAPAG